MRMSAQTSSHIFMRSCCFGETNYSFFSSWKMERKQSSYPNKWTVGHFLKAVAISLWVHKKQNVATSFVFRRFCTPGWGLRSVRCNLAALPASSVNPMILRETFPLALKQYQALLVHILQPNGVMWMQQCQNTLCRKKNKKQKKIHAFFHVYKHMHTKTKTQ